MSWLSGQTCCRVLGVVLWVKEVEIQKCRCFPLKTWHSNCNLQHVFHGNSFWVFFVGVWRCIFVRVSSELRTIFGTSVADNYISKPREACAPTLIHTKRDGCRLLLIHHNKWICWRDDITSQLPMLSDFFCFTACPRHEVAWASRAGYGSRESLCVEDAETGFLKRKLRVIDSLITSGGFRQDACDDMSMWFMLLPFVGQRSLAFWVDPRLAADLRQMKAWRPMKAHEGMKTWLFTFVCMIFQSFLIPGRKKSSYG